MERTEIFFHTGADSMCLMIAAEPSPEWSFSPHKGDRGPWPARPGLSVEFHVESTPLHRMENH